MRIKEFEQNKIFFRLSVYSTYQNIHTITNKKLIVKINEMPVKKRQTLKTMIEVSKWLVSKVQDFNIKPEYKIHLTQVNATQGKLLTRKICVIHRDGIEIHSYKIWKMNNENQNSASK